MGALLSMPPGMTLTYPLRFLPDFTFHTVKTRCETGAVRGREVNRAGCLHTLKQCHSHRHLGMAACGVVLGGKRPWLGNGRQTHNTKERSRKYGVRGRPTGLPGHRLLYGAGS